MFVLDIVIILSLLFVNVLNFIHFKRYSKIFWKNFFVLNLFTVLSIFSLVVYIIDIFPSWICDVLHTIIILCILSILCVTLYQAVKGNHYDRMTGVKNRCAFEFAVKHYVPKNKKIGVLFLDIDKLKETNDLYGHSRGDELIRLVANISYECIPNKQNVFRIGGDEFVLIVDCEDEKTLENIKKQIVEKLNSYNNQNNSKYSVSIGHYLVDAKENLEKAVNMADEKMYKDKQSKNKNRR